MLVLFCLVFSLGKKETMARQSHWQQESDKDERVLGKRQSPLDL